MKTMKTVSNVSLLLAFFDAKKTWNRIYTSHDSHFGSVSIYYGDRTCAFDISREGGEKKQSTV